MIRPRAIASAALGAALFLTGCRSKPVRVAVLPPVPPPVMISVPPLTHPTEPEAELPLEEPEALTDLLPRHIVYRFRPWPVQQVTLAPAPPPPLELGQLTAGDTAPLRQQADDLLRSQQRRLNATPAAVAALHSQQIEQARLFLKQADDAWQKADVDGALTLATKAKVLLDEIAQ